MNYCIDAVYRWCCQGLELNPYDAWATHALAHIFEHQGRQDEGISLLSSTVKDWAVGTKLPSKLT